MFGASSFTAQSILDFSPVSKPVTQHLCRVYSTLSTTIGSAFLGAYLVHRHLNQEHSTLFSLGFLASLIAFQFTAATKDNHGLRTALLHTVGFSAGAATLPLVQYANYMDPSIVYSAFFGALGVFASFSAAAIWNKDRRFLYMGGTLLTALSTLMWMNLINLFFQFRMWYWAEMYISIVLFSVFVAFDTQMIIARFEQGEADHLRHSLTLFMDAFNIFVKTLELLTRKEQDRKRRRR